MEKHSVVISGHSTSLSLEPEFWSELRVIAKDRKVPVASLIERIDNCRRGNLSAAVRVYVLNFLKQKVIDNKQA